MPINLSPEFNRRAIVKGGIFVFATLPQQQAVLNIYTFYSTQYYPKRIVPKLLERKARQGKARQEHARDWSKECLQR